MVRFTITPWRTQYDLLQVRSQLYASPPPHSTDPDPRQEAVSRVMAWKLRGNLPHAVESTALLIDALLHHDTSKNSIFSIRAVYSAAFCRFVTGFCDIGRAKERMLEPSSMLDIAKQIGMPVEFVALRHEATHEELPGVGRLVAASRQALEWLRRVYWSRLEEPETPEQVTESVARVKGEARKVFKEYRGQRREILKGGKKKSAVAVHLDEQLRMASAACKELVARNRVRLDALVQVLVDDRLLIPSNRELGSPMDGAFLMWDELLVRLTRDFDAFLQMLFQRMFDTLHTDPSTNISLDAEKEAAYMWLAHLIDDKQGSFKAQTKESVRVEMMKWCCLSPGYWTRMCGQMLLDSGDVFFQECWQDLFEASILENSDAADPELHMAVDTIGSPSRIEQRSIAALSADQEASGRWVRIAIAPNLPIGVVVSQHA